MRADGGTNTPTKLIQRVLERETIRRNVLSWRVRWGTSSRESDSGTRCVASTTRTTVRRRARHVQREETRVNESWSCIVNRSPVPASRAGIPRGPRH